MGNTQARQKYLTVARTMKEYEDTHYERWLEHVEAVLPGLMKHTVLVKVSSTPQHPHSSSGMVLARDVQRSNEFIMPHTSSMSEYTDCSNRVFTSFSSVCVHVCVCCVCLSIGVHVCMQYVVYT